MPVEFTDEEMQQILADLDSKSRREKVRASDNNRNNRGSIASARTLNAFGFSDEDSAQAAGKLAYEQDATGDLTKFLTERYGFDPTGAQNYATTVVGEGPDSKLANKQQLVDPDLAQKPYETEAPWPAYWRQEGDPLAGNLQAGKDAENAVRAKPSFTDAHPDQAQIVPQNPHEDRLQRAQALRKQILGF